MLVIFVDAVNRHLELGRAHMDAIPREGEIVELELSYMRNSENLLLFAKFKVNMVSWEAKNTMQVERWMRPYDDKANGSVTLHVWAANSKTTAYIERIEAQLKRDKQGV